MKREYLINAANLHLLREFARVLEGATEGEASISRDRFLDPLEPARLDDVAQEITLLRAIETDIPIEWLFSEFVVRHGMDALIVRIVNSDTIGDGFRFGIDYVQLVTNTVVTFHKTQKDGALAVSFCPDDMENPLVEFSYRWLVAHSVHRCLSLFEDGIHLKTLDRKAPDLCALLQRISDGFDFIDIRLSRGEAIVTLPSYAALSPMPHRNDIITRAVDPELRRRVLETSFPTTLADRIRHYVLRDRAFDLTQDEICKAFHIEPRTLRRKLLVEGTSFGEILRDLRRGRALHLVGETTTPLKLVAVELAYKSDASFNMAFKLWTGMTPGAYRKAASI